MYPHDSWRDTFTKAPAFSAHTNPCTIFRINFLAIYKKIRYNRVRIYFSPGQGAERGVYQVRLSEYTHCCNDAVLLYKYTAINNRRHFDRVSLYQGRRYFFDWLGGFLQSARRVLNVRKACFAKNNDVRRKKNKSAPEKAQQEEIKRGLARIRQWSASPLLKTPWAMPCGNSHIDYSISSQLLCVKDFRNI